MPSVLRTALACFCMLPGLFAAQARADEGGLPSASLSLRYDYQDDASDRVPFGREGSQTITIGALAGYDLSNEADLNIHGAWGNFLADDIELSLELALWAHIQEGDEAVGVNPNLVIRWHFWSSEARGPGGDPRWTAYTDLGVGVIYSSDETPEGGTRFNFSPRVGVGLTRLINDRGWRAQVGLRWVHVSNARIEGQDDNPSRDGVAVYAGLVIPIR